MADFLERSTTELLERIVACFRRERVPYALIGAWALSVWGTSRATNDMDFLVLVDEAEFSRLSDRMIHAAGRYLAEVESHAHLLNLEFLADVPIHDSLEVDGVVIDYAKDKRIVAIELLDAGKRTTRKPLDLIGLAIVRSRCHAVYAEKRKKMPRPLLRHG